MRAVGVALVVTIISCKLIAALLCLRKLSAADLRGVAAAAAAAAAVAAVHPGRRSCYQMTVMMRQSCLRVPRGVASACRGCEEARSPGVAGNAPRYFWTNSQTAARSLDDADRPLPQPAPVKGPHSGPCHLALAAGRGTVS